MSELDVSDDDVGSVHESKISETVYTPFGGKYILHPRCFVLASTLEWIRLPRNLAGYVIGRSSWGRRGLIIATATGVHPGFTGCLTLELTNVGEVPITIIPGLALCQLFLQEVASDSIDVDQTPFLAQRKPTVGRVQLDEVAKLLKQGRIGPSGPANIPA
jgi:dCTP deaminase